MKNNYNKNRILIMDDDEIIRFVIEQLLLKSKFDVSCTENGFETIKLFKDSFHSNPFSVVILDLTIANGMGGIDTATELKKIDSNVKIIALTGYSQDPIVNDYSQFGFESVLIKPFTNDELKKTIETVIQKRGNNDKF